jgi:hypothetical protein
MPDKPLFPIINTDSIRKEDANAGRSGTADRIGLHTKLSGRLLRAAVAAVLQKMEQERTTPKVGRNSMKRLTYKDPGANTIEVSGRIRSFERYARKHQVRYHIEKELGTNPPKWTVYFKANQADALTAAFKEYTQKDLTRSTRPSLLTQLHKFKELAQALGRDRVKNKEHGGPER